MISCTCDWHQRGEEAALWDKIFNLWGWMLFPAVCGAQYGSHSQKTGYAFDLPSDLSPQGLAQKLAFVSLPSGLRQLPR